MENYKDLFLKDAKEYVKYIVDYDNKSNGDSFDLLMSFFATDDKKFGGYTYDKKFISFSDLEKRDFARYVYGILGWNNNSYFDVINSFWTTFSCAIIKTYQEMYNDDNEDKFYFFYKTNRPHLPYNKKPTSENSNTYPKKYLEYLSKRPNCDFLKIINRTNEKYQIKRMAKLCGCVANFMPCPDAYEKGKLSYNQLKGVLPDVQDYFPLMINKIEKCYVEKTGIKYYVDNKQELISHDTVEKWHKWFLENIEEYCLEDYYDVKDGHLIYKPLFDCEKCENKQTLKYPVPQKEDEIKECLEEMIKRIESRAMRMAKKLEQQ